MGMLEIVGAEHSQKIIGSANSISAPIKLALLAEERRGEEWGVGPVYST